MSKTKIDAVKFETRIRLHSNLTLTPQSAFVKVECPDNGLRVYVPMTDVVSRVDLSGFLYPSGPGIVDLGDKSFGAVKQQIDFEKPEEEILETFEAILEYMVKQPKVAKEARTRAAKKVQAVGWSIKAPAKKTEETSNEAPTEASSEETLPLAASAS